MKIKILKRCAAAVIAISMLSTGLVAGAAENSPTNNTALEAYGDSEWLWPAPTETQMPYDQYLSALLDVYYQNDSQAFVALGLGTAEDAALIYNTVLDSELNGLDLESLLGTECPDTLKNDFRALMTQLLGSARYAVTNCELQADGTYKITIIYEQTKFFEPLMDLYMTIVTDMAAAWFADSASFPSDEDMMIQLLAALCSSMRVCLENITYADPAVTTVSVNPQNGTYLPDIEDIIRLENLLFDIDTMFD